MTHGRGAVVTKINGKAKAVGSAVGCGELKKVNY